MKKTIISAALLTIACVAFAASPRVDRTTNPLSLGASNSVAGTAVVSKSPTNEYVIIDAGCFVTSSVNTVVSFGMTFVASPTVLIAPDSTGTAVSTATIIATPTTTQITVSNSGLSSPTLKFLIYGIKRVGYSQP